MENKKLSESDFVLLLEKKYELLNQLFQTSQRQLTQLDWTIMDSLLNEKDQWIQGLRKTDDVIAIWHEQFSRPSNNREALLEEKIQQILQDIWESEEQFERRLIDEQAKISEEMSQLGNRSQLKKYLGSHKTSGKHFSFRK